MTRFCDGLSRRDALRVGSAALFGSAVGLPQLLRASDAAGGSRDTSLIFVFLHGGLSTIDTLDMKPDAPAEFGGDRLTDRRALLDTVDRFHRAAEARANQHAGAVATFRDRAFDLMTSPAAKRAFDIHAEPDRLRDEYGRTSLGQSCLMAR